MIENILYTILVCLDFFYLIYKFVVNLYQWINIITYGFLTKVILLINWASHIIVIVVLICIVTLHHFHCYTTKSFTNHKIKLNITLFEITENSITRIFFNEILTALNKYQVPNGIGH